VFPLELWTESETVLRDPVVLRAPVALDVRVTPPLDWLGRAWRVTILRASDFSSSHESEPVYEGTAGKDGTLALRQQRPGSFFVQIFDSVGNSFYANPDVSVLRPEDGKLDLEIHMVDVDGEIHLGEEPLAATLWFGGRHGGARSEMHSDAEGLFRGVLPRAGEWRVEVRSHEPPIDANLRVMVKADRDDRARVILQIPDTHLFGEVVGEDGTPVSGARVTLGAAGLGVRADTDAEGGFSFRGFAPGPVTLSASKSVGGEVWVSDGQLMMTLTSSARGPVRLQLQPTTLIAGSVRCEGQPIAGALVEIATRRPPTRGFRDTTRTGLDGAFSARIRRGVESIQVIVSPPGRALFTTEVAPVSPLDLETPARGGSLEITAPKRGGEEPKPQLVVFYQGLPIPTTTLYTWARGHGVVSDGIDRPISLPDLSPGRYRACLGDPSTLATTAHDLGDWTLGLTECREADVVEGLAAALDFSSTQPDEDAPSR
jgi:hypothetical protein